MRGSNLQPADYETELSTERTRPLGCYDVHVSTSKHPTLAHLMVAELIFVLFCLLCSLLHMLSHVAQLIVSSPCSCVPPQSEEYDTIQ